MRNVLSSIMLTALIGTFGVANENASSNNGTGNKGAGVFMGLEGGASVALTNYKLSWPIRSGKATSKDNMKDNIGGGITGLKVGYYFNPNHRLYAGYYYHYLGKDEDTLHKPYGTSGYSQELDLLMKYNIHKVAIGYDFLPYITNDVKFIIGGYLGYGVVRAKTNVVEVRQYGSDGKPATNNPLKVDTRKFTDNHSSLFLGLNIGYLQEFGKYGDLEFGGRFEYLNAFKKSRTYIITSSGNKDMPSPQDTTAYALSASFYVGYSYKF